MNDIEFKEGHFCELELINKFPGAHVENIFRSPIDYKEKNLILMNVSRTFPRYFRSQHFSSANVENRNSYHDDFFGRVLVLISFHFSPDRKVNFGPSFSFWGQRNVELLMKKQRN